MRDDVVKRLRSISGVDGGTSLRELCVQAAAIIEEQRGEIGRILDQAAAEIERLREERLEQQEAAMRVSREEGYKLLMDEIKTLREERRWVPSEEKMPPENVAVLVWHDAGGVEMAYREKGSWFMSFLGYSVSDSSYTHWMPLPAPPEPAP